LEEDVLAAEEQYSQYAYEALLVENGVTIPEIESVLLGFLESEPLIKQEKIIEIFRDADLPEDRHAAVLFRLVEMSFLGIEIRDGKYVYPEPGSEMDRALALQARRSIDASGRNYQIHRAFHKFLVIESVVD
jgi:hypothetical protein